MRKWTWTIALILLGCGGTAEAPVEDNGAHTTAPASASEGQETAPVNDGAPAGPGAQNVSACLIQDGERISENAIVAIGTEPFWGANVEGRCVTYSTPENQDGVRIWTRFEGTSENGQWSGALDDKPFVMITRREQGCSDGMSDNRYPIAVTLTVRGEQRRGCAEPKSEREKRRPA